MSDRNLIESAVTAEPIAEDKPITLYQLYRNLQAENQRLRAENNLLLSLVESWTKRFEELLGAQK
jgi:FtsZ-binding cell division protein ZapB